MLSQQKHRADWPTAKKQSSLGNDEPYASFLAYFDKKLTDMPLQEFLQRFVFGQSDLAQEMFLRLFHGVLHPLISFGFGVEFQQSAVMSEGLAQGYCHRDDFVYTAGKILSTLLPCGRSRKLTLLRRSQSSQT
jgi:hypothetical protein